MAKANKEKTVKSLTIKDIQATLIAMDDKFKEDLNEVNLNIEDINHKLSKSNKDLARVMSRLGL